MGGGGGGGGGICSINYSYSDAADKRLATFCSSDCEENEACAPHDSSGGATCVLDFLPEKCHPISLCLGRCQPTSSVVCNIFSRERNAITEELLERYRFGCS